MAKPARHKSTRTTTTSTDSSGSNDNGGVGRRAVMKHENDDDFDDGDDFIPIASNNEHDHDHEDDGAAAAAADDDHGDDLATTADGDSKKTSKSKSSHQPKRVKIFVKNLPENATSQTLEQLFSDIGPIRRSFVITEKGSKICTGVGIVQFALEDDAKESIKKLQGHIWPDSNRKLLLDWAMPRRSLDERKSESHNHDSDGEGENDGGQHPRSRSIKFDDDEDDDDKAQEEVEAEDQEEPEHHEEKRPAPQPRAAKPRSEAAVAALAKAKAKTLPSRIMVAEFSGIEKYIDLPGQIKKAFTRHSTKLNTPSLIEPQVDNPTTVHVTYGTPEAALSAIENFKDFSLGFRGVTVSVRSLAEGKKARLIVRNIAFSATEGQLRAHFAKIGTIEEIALPKGIRGGFGFVQYHKRVDAAKAVEELNAKPFCGRPIAIDWAVPRDIYLKHQVESEIKAEEEKDFNELIGKSNDDEESEESEEEALEDGGDDDDAMEQEADDGNDLEEDNGEGDDEDTDAKAAQVTKPRESDVHRGTSLFLRNLSFDSTEESIRARFQAFGDVRGCYIVMDKETGRSRGTAFVNFKTPEAAQLALKAAYPRGFPANSGSKLLSQLESTIELDGRALVITPSVDRTTAQQLTAARPDRKDKRNLYLMAEGLIREGEPASAGVSKSDMMKRAQGYAEKKAKLMNPNFSVSRTRLSIRNLPTTVDEKQLKQIAIAEVKKASGRVPKLQQVKIVRSDDRVDGSGRLRSRGFAFIEFIEHEDALRALRAINNNPALFGGQRRPIVEFALENALALQKRQQAQTKRESVLRAKQKQAKEQGAEVVTTKSAKETKRQLKKEARRERRKENRKKPKKTAAESSNEGETAAPTTTVATSATTEKTKKAAAAKPTASEKQKKQQQQKPAPASSTTQQAPATSKKPAKAEKRKRPETTTEDFETRHMNKRSKRNVEAGNEVATPAEEGRGEAHGRRGRKSRVEDRFDEVIARHASKYADTPENRRRAPSSYGGSNTDESALLTRNTQPLRWYE